MNIERTHPAAWLWLSAIIVALDQVTKFLVVRFLDLYERVEVLPILDFTYVRNTGAAFSMLAGASGLAALALHRTRRGYERRAGLWLWRLPRGRRMIAIALSLILGGALGNVIDRIMHGFVIDFIHAHCTARISRPSTSRTARSPSVPHC
jgi:signal peptidase II